MRFETVRRSLRHLYSVLVIALNPSPPCLALPFFNMGFLENNKAQRIITTMFYNANQDCKGHCNRASHRTLVGSCVPPSATPKLSSLFLRIFHTSTILLRFSLKPSKTKPQNRRCAECSLPRADGFMARTGNHGARRGRGTCGRPCS